MKPIRPMKGVAPKGELRGFPYYASCKIDGIRAVVKDGVVLSKSGKPIPNRKVQEMFGHLHGADGEITVGPAHARFEGDDVYDRTRGPVMTKACRDADFWFHVFDRWDRLDAVKARLESLPHLVGETEGVSLVNQVLITDPKQLARFERHCLEGGYEGAMLRKAASFYKFGQSTEAEGCLLKIKRFHDAEAEVIGYKEQMTNTNAAVRDTQGYTRRSSSKAGKVPNGTLGALTVRDLGTGTVFDIGGGPGLSAKRRAHLWSIRDLLIGQLVTYTFQEIGTKNAPRLPQLKGFRDPIDMDNLNIH